MGVERDTIPTPPLVAIAAFRYALGRATYIVSEVAGWLIRHKDKLSEDDRALIVREIDEACRGNRVGHRCDERDWLKVARELDPGNPDANADSET